MPSGLCMGKIGVSGCFTVYLFFCFELNYKTDYPWSWIIGGSPFCLAYFVFVFDFDGDSILVFF